MLGQVGEVVDLEAAALGLLGGMEPVRAVDELLAVALVGQIEPGLAAIDFEQQDGVSAFVSGQVEEVVILPEAGAVARHRFREQERRAAVEALAEARPPFGELFRRVGGSLGRGCRFRREREQRDGHAEPRSPTRRCEGEPVPVTMQPR